MRRFLFFVLMLFVVSGCCYLETNYEHYTPVADYRIKGSVIDEFGTPINNIQIVVYELYRNAQTNCAILYNPDTLNTDQLGSYIFSRDSVFVSGFRIIATDIDGDGNGGEFLSDSVDICGFEYDFVNNSSNPLYKGVAIKDDQIIKLQSIK